MGDGETLHYHDMAAAVLVKGKEETVLPLNPEFIRNEDGQEKQDCERNAAKRWLASNAERYKWLNPIVLGDDIYADYPTCVMIMEKGLHFLFTCKPSSHQWLHDSIDGNCMERKTVRAWNGREHFEYRYQWHTGLEIREEEPTLKVNYLLLEIWNEEKGKITYRNSWATDLAIDDKNVAEMAECARARWKIKNEHNNVLKHHGYHLEHNFGHGQEHACEIYATVNLPAFQMHGIMLLLDEGYQKARKSIRRRDEFFAGLRIFFCGQTSLVFRATLIKACQPNARICDGFTSGKRSPKAELYTNTTSIWGKFYAVKARKDAGNADLWNKSALP